MRYKVARELCKAFNDIAPGITIDVSMSDSTDYVEVRARSEWHGVVRIPVSTFAKMSDDEAADTLFNSAVSAVKIAVEQKNG